MASEINVDVDAAEDHQSMVEPIENLIENTIIDAPTTYEPPSPLTGCYLLIILGEPHSLEHKDIILQRLIKGNCSSFIFSSKILFLLFS